MVYRWQNFFQTSKFFFLIFLQPLDQNKFLVPNLKDQIHTCLKLEAQGYGMTFKMLYGTSDFPYFTSHRGKCLYNHDCIYGGFPMKRTVAILGYRTLAIKGRSQLVAAPPPPSLASVKIEMIFHIIFT